MWVSTWGRIRLSNAEVQFLTPDEIQQSVSAVPIRKGPKSFDMKWLCFRALVEVLLGSRAPRRDEIP